MSVYSVEVYDLPTVLRKMALSGMQRAGTANDPILPDMSRHGTRLERMRNFTAALTSRVSQTPAPSMTSRFLMSPPLTAQSKQARSMNAEVYCGPCSRDNMHHEAAGYCLECAEYFCETCIKHHKNLKITKSHIVRDRKKMPKIKHPIEADNSLENCETHTGELLRYFCKSHDEPVCSVCATLNHRQCENLVYIPEIKAKKTNRNCVAMIKHINALAGQFERMKDETRKNMQLNDLQRVDFVKAIENLHQEFFEKLQKLEQELIRDVDHLHGDEAGYLEGRINVCDEAIKGLHNASGALTITLQNGIESKSFLQLKKVAKQVNYFENLVEDINKKNSSPMRFSFQSDPKFLNYMKTLEEIGTLQITNKSTRTTMPVMQYNIKSRSDAYQVCDITGCAALGDGRIVLTDMYNESLKLLDSTYTLVTQTKLSAEPWDVCVISNEQVAISLPREKKLQIFSIGKTLRPLKKIGNQSPSQKNSQFYGVDFLLEKFYVTCPKDEIPNIKVLDMQGKQLMQINSNNQEQESLFCDPLYISVAFDGKTAYISDSGNSSIVRLQLKQEGESEKVKVPDDLPPGGISVQADKEVFFCGFKTNNIQHLSENWETENGENFEELIGSEGGLLKPQSLCYCPAQRHLVVTMQKSDTIKVFELL